MIKIGKFDVHNEGILFRKFNHILEKRVNIIDEYVDKQLKNEWLKLALSHLENLSDGRYNLFLFNDFSKIFVSRHENNLSIKCVDIGDSKACSVRVHISYNNISFHSF